MSFAKINLAEDICPISEFRTEVNAVLQRAKSTHRPIVLTQHGKSTAVLLDINDYQDLIYIEDYLKLLNFLKDQQE